MDKFYLILFDHKKMELSVEGPMTDDKEWVEVINLLEETGRSFTYSRFEGTDFEKASQFATGQFECKQIASYIFPFEFKARLLPTGNSTTNLTERL